MIFLYAITISLNYYLCTAHCIIRTMHYSHFLQPASEPSIPVNLTATSTGSTSILVFWEPPLRFIGDILYYEITFRGIESPNQINSTFYQSSNLFSIATSVQINSYAIMPFSTYNVSVRAVNEVGPGPFSNEVLVQTIAGGKCFDHKELEF